jgi:septum formation protein
MAEEKKFILASSSATRRDLLTRAGLTFEVVAPGVDEEAMKASLRSRRATGGATAEALAELKAVKISGANPGVLVIGADQMLVCGTLWFSKPETVEQAREQLQTLRGKTHELFTCVCVARDGARLWHHTETARLTMRNFSDGFLDDYLSQTGSGALQSVGAYQVEGDGIQLFSRILGDYFAIMGLPILPLLDFLRTHMVVAR